MGFLKRTFAKRDSSKAGPSKPTPSQSPSASAAGPRGILRKPSSHFITYDEQGRPQTDSGDSSKSDEHLPMKSNSPDAPSLRKPASRPSPVRAGSTITEAEILKHFRPSTQKCDAVAAPGTNNGLRHVTYMSVNHTPTPGRFYRGYSDKEMPHPGLRTVLLTLQYTLNKDSKRIQDHVEWDDVMNGEWWDNEDQEGLKDCMRTKEWRFLVQQAERDWMKKQRDLHVFGGHIKTINQHQATDVYAHGFKFRVPIILASSVEEIYRRGMTESDLFRRPPNKRRSIKLIYDYDQLWPREPVANLRKERIHDVVNLLGFWINALPAPLFHRSLFDGLSAWCVEPALVRERERRYKIGIRHRKGEDGEYYSETDSEIEDSDMEKDGLPSMRNRKKRLRMKQRQMDKSKRRALFKAHPELAPPGYNQRRWQMYKQLVDLETPQVHHARLVMLLIAPHCFAIFVYLFTFFVALLDHPENGITPAYLAERFSWKLLGGPNRELSKELMEWLLTRWDRIVHAYKSTDAMAWEKRMVEVRGRAKEGQQQSESPRQGNAASPSSTPRSGNSSDTRVGSSAHERERRGSGESDGSYPSSSSSARGEQSSPSSSSHQFYTPRSSLSSDDRDSQPQSSSSSSPPARSQMTRPTSRRPSVAAGRSFRSASSRRSLRGPFPTPANGVVIDPFDTEDTPVISPQARERDYEAEAEDCPEGEENSDSLGSADDWEPPQRATFEAIERLLHPKAQRRPLVTKGVAEPSVCSYGFDAESVSSRDDIDDIIDTYSDEPQSEPQPESQLPWLRREVKPIKPGQSQQKVDRPVRTKVAVQLR